MQICSKRTNDCIDSIFKQLEMELLNNMLFLTQQSFQYFHFEKNSFTTEKALMSARWPFIAADD